MTLRYIDLFSGLGGIRLGLEQACQARGVRCQCVLTSEIKPAALLVHQQNHPGEVVQGDITALPSEAVPAFDVLLAGFPCQAFSIMGKMNGFADTRGTMFFEVARILAHHHPRAILLENVKNLVGHDEGKTFKVILATLRELGYHVKWRVLNALDFGVPQKRERVLIAGFTDPAHCDAFSFDFPKQPYDLARVLEADDKVDPSLLASPAILQKRQQSVAGKRVFYPSIWHENKGGNISVLPYACALRTGASYNYLLVNGVRRPTSRELLRLQGFPEAYRVVVPHSEVRRQTGNSVAVPMIRAVAQRMTELL